MTNDCIRIGLASETTSLKRLSLLSYKELNRFDVPSYYKLCAISKASGILASRKKSIRRGFPTKDPYLRKPILVSCYGFKIVNGKVRIPLGNKKFEEILSNKTFTTNSIRSKTESQFVHADRNKSVVVRLERGSSNGR